MKRPPPPSPPLHPPTPSSRVRRWTGPLTAELVLRPGDFGLGRVPARLCPDATTTVVCGYCSTGCGLTVHLREGQAINLSADPEYPVNLGMACPKGWEALTPLGAPDRLRAPMMRHVSTGGIEPVSWVRAMHEFTRRMKEIQERHGPHAIAFLSTGQICTEEMALLGTLFKFGMGGLHCDSNTRQCMATSHVAYKESFGFDAPPFTYADFEASDVLVFIGANPCIAHPILWQRVLRNPRRPEIIVIDPRATETAQNATLHVPLAPKSDLVLLYGLARALLETDAVDAGFIREHTTGFEAFRAFIQPFHRERVLEVTGLRGEVWDACVSALSSRHRRVSYWWTMGVNQGHESTRTAQAIINLALMTGNLGKPGTGANSITGQCNAMGSRLFANVTSLPAGREFSSATDRAEVSRILGIPAARIPAERSWAYDRIVDAIDAGEIRGLWVIATNGSHSWIDQKRFERALSKLDFLVVQDLYATTDTARHADLLLPAAGWGEKEGTLINSERRIGLVKKVLRPPGEALADFAIFKLVAEAWGCGDLFRSWRSPESAFQILKRLSAGSPCDITGIRDYRHLDDEGGIQWPFPASTGLSGHPQPTPVDARPEVQGHARNAAHRCARTERRLFEDGQFFTRDGRARFVFEAPRPPGEVPDAAYPLVLLTGRGSSAQWHTNTRTSKSAVLRSLYPAECYVEIHPADARQLGLRPHGIVRVISRRGSVEARAFVTPTVPRGTVFLPMHYDGVNRLTHGEFDPYSRQPSYKHAAVRIEPGGTA